jgi:putative ABC transport system permease protein
MTRPGFILRQLRAKPMRTVLTAAAFALSVGLLGFLLTLSDALQQEWSPYMGQRVIVTAKTSFFERLPMAYLPKIEATPGVYRVVPFDFVVAFYRDSRPENQVPLSASQSSTMLEVYREANVPPEQVKEWLADPTGACVGPVVARKFKWKVGDRIVLKAPVAGGVVEMTIRAVMRYKLDNGVYIHRRYFEALTGDLGQAAMFWILVKSRDEMASVTASLSKEFENAPSPVTVMTEKQWQLMFMQMLGNVKLLIGSIGMATAFALLLITSNSLAMSARERRGETALLRVLGFQRGEIVRLLLGEAAVYGVLGAILGTGMIHVFCRLVGTALDETQLAGVGELLVVTPPIVAVAVAAAAVLSMVAGVIPALGLSRQPIASLLRHRG